MIQGTHCNYNSVNSGPPQMFRLHAPCISTPPRLLREKRTCSIGVALEYFVGLQRYTGTLVTSTLPSIETFCEVIHRTNHATKCPTPSLDKDSFYSKQFTSSQALKDEVTWTEKIILPRGSSFGVNSFIGTALEHLRNSHRKPKRFIAGDKGSPQS